MEEEQELRTLYLEGNSLRVIAGQMVKSPESVRQKIRNMNLSQLKQHPTKQPPCCSSPPEMEGMFSPLEALAMAFQQLLILNDPNSPKSQVWRANLAFQRCLDYIQEFGTVARYIETERKLKKLDEEKDPEPSKG